MLLSWSIGNYARSYDVLVVLLAAEAEPHNYAKVGLFLQGRVVQMSDSRFGGRWWRARNPMTPKQTASGRTAGRRRHEHGVLQQRAPMSIRSMTGEDLCTEVSTEKEFLGKIHKRQKTKGWIVPPGMRIYYHLLTRR